MPYTLAKFFLWGLLLAVAGGLIGWMLRSLKARAEVARVRASVVDHVEVDRLRRRLANLEPVVAERNRLRMELADVRGRSAGTLGFAATAPAPPADDHVVDVAAGAAILGRTVELDDLTVVEGIGPKIAALCHGIGITGWRDLAAAEVARLQAMLDAGGPRFRLHRPQTWPHQGRLLAEGRWEEFKRLTDELADGP